MLGSGLPMEPVGKLTLVLGAAVPAGKTHEGGHDDDEDEASEGRDHQEPPLLVERLLRHICTPTTHIYFHHYPSYSMSHLSQLGFSSKKV